MNIALINRKVKQLEKHLDIVINYNKEDVATVFEKFTTFSVEEATFVLHSAENAKRYYMKYSFISGEISDTKSEVNVCINDLFSNRHLRSILFAAKEAQILQDEKLRESFILFFLIGNKRIHNTNVPVLSIEVDTEQGHQKRWFMISKLNVTTRCIEMEGLLSIVDYGNFHQPVIATCKYDMSKRLFTYHYMFERQEMTDCYEGTEYSASTTSISTILYSYTEFKMENEGNNLPQSNYPELSLACRKVFKGKQLHLFSELRGALELWEIIEATFYDIKSINENEIVFRVCDGESLLSDLYYDRNRQKIMAYQTPCRSYGRRRKISYKFSDSPALSGQVQFDKAIKMIEKEYPQ